MKPCRPPRGAALLVAMIVLTLVATLAAGMIWQQSRAIGVEGAERARVQAAWILGGAMNLGRVLLRLDARTPGVDHLNELWATPLQEASLSSMLAQDRDNNVVDGAPQAVLSGAITDAQQRYNLRNLVDPATRKIAPAELEALGRLCETASVPPQTAQLLAQGLQAAWRAETDGAKDDDEGTGDAPLAPQAVDQLGWLGLDAESVRRLQPYVELLPEPTPLNINTASPEVLAAVIGLDVASAKRLESKRPFKTLQDARGDIPASIPLDPKRLGVGSNYFIIAGVLRMDGRVLEERLLVKRDNRQVLPLARTRQALLPATP